MEVVLQYRSRHGDIIGHLSLTSSHDENITTHKMGEGGAERSVADETIVEKDRAGSVVKKEIH